VTALPAIAFAVALAWSTLLLVVGGVVLLRARDVFQRIVALDLLAVLVVSILALLSYLQDVPYYMDAAVALALLSFVATAAAARYLGTGGPFT
jgi:multicomponent Na+:H+ antiporter subunit F